LEWRKASGSILSISVCKDKIDLAVASHPSLDDPVQPLPSIPLKRETMDNHKVLSQSVLDELAHIVQDWKVCGMVVSWPVQKEGRCGAPCGRVLHTLDQLTERSNVLNANRPVCLWDLEHNRNHEDEWGRDPLYGHTTTKKTVHVASKEQYADHKCAAADMWEDFCRTQWPEFAMPRTRTSSTSATTSSSSPSINCINPQWLDKYEDTAAYTKAAL
jgi:RNase H-fold protein (predicted Holliday junction resolvase)